MRQIIIDSIKNFYKEQEPYIENLRTTSTCSALCNHCCHALIRFSVAEAIVILNEHTVSQREITDYMDHLREVNNNMDEWFKHKWPCLFLKNGKCSIYTARPWVCRTLFVTSNPNQCVSDNATVVNIMESNPAYFKVMNHIASIAQLPWGGIPQPMALRWAQAWSEGGLIKMTPIMLKDLSKNS